MLLNQLTSRKFGATRSVEFCSQLLSQGGSLILHNLNDQIPISQNSRSGN